MRWESRFHPMTHAYTYTNETAHFYRISTETLISVGRRFRFWMLHSMTIPSYRPVFWDRVWLCTWLGPGMTSGCPKPDPRAEHSFRATRSTCMTILHVLQHPCHKFTTGLLVKAVYVVWHKRRFRVWRVLHESSWNPLRLQPCKSVTFTISKMTPVWRYTPWNSP